MERVTHELEVLSRAVAYKNLSGASMHVGLSQPQLSRIVRKIEDTLSIVVLDRSAKRNATWTPTAYKLCEFYTKKMRAFDQELGALIGISQTKELKVGTLEGLASVALQFVHGLFEQAGIRLIEVDVFDLDRLEELFSRGELDIIFSSREPGRKKFRNCRELGVQSLERVNSNPHFEVMSTFEYGTKRDKLKALEKVLISNSLAIRKDWFEKFGGVGTFPSELKRAKSGRHDTERVVLLGSDTLSPSVWAALEKTSFI
jgi:hypothetical protein